MVRLPLLLGAVGGLLSGTAHAIGCSSDDQCVQSESTDGNWRCVEAGFGEQDFAEACIRDADGESSYCVCGTVDCDSFDSSIEQNTDLKQLLVIGDSISDAYFESLEATLGDEWQVLHAMAYGGEMNNGNANLGHKCVSDWLGPDPNRWDAITFNFGLHDLAQDQENLAVDTFKTKLRHILNILKQETRASLIWVTITPIPSGMCEPSMPPRRQSDVLAYNSAADDLMAGEGRVTRCDAHEAIISKCGEGYVKCDVAYCEGPHFTQEGIGIISDTITGCIHDSVTSTADTTTSSEDAEPESKSTNCDHVYDKMCADTAGEYTACLYCIHSNQDTFLNLGCVQHGIDLVETFCGTAPTPSPALEAGKVLAADEGGGDQEEESDDGDGDDDDDDDDDGDDDDDRPNADNYYHKNTDDDDGEADDEMYGDGLYGTIVADSLLLEATSEEAKGGGAKGGEAKVVEAKVVEAKGDPASEQEMAVDAPSDSGGSLGATLAIISGAMVAVFGVIGLLVWRNWGEREEETTPRPHAHNVQPVRSNTMTNNPATGSVFEISTKLSIQLPQCPEASYSTSRGIV
jgi:hypothetical protein